MSRERKIYAAVLLVAGAGLAADRAFLGISGARPVQAAEFPSGQPPERSGPIAIATPTLASRLKLVGDVPRTVDLLEATLQRLPAPVEAEVQPVRDQAADLRGQFASSHHLSALASNGRGANALINGRAVSIGEEIGGYVLTEVTREGAVFSGPGGTVELKLPQAR
ncbi:MAG: hypothetical protein KF805_09715 [Phycisphaeraceae bacterium]|nr:hypothetical protein [Phycisphaeraceae bacterium]